MLVQIGQRNSPSKMSYSAKACVDYVQAHAHTRTNTHIFLSFNACDVRAQAINYPNPPYNTGTLLIESSEHLFRENGHM